VVLVHAVLNHVNHNGKARSNEPLVVAAGDLSYNDSATNVCPSPLA